MMRAPGSAKAGRKTLLRKSTGFNPGDAKGITGLKVKTETAEIGIIHRQAKDPAIRRELAPRNTVRHGLSRFYH